jgi:hypothetical protein
MNSQLDSIGMQALLLRPFCEVLVASVHVGTESHGTDEVSCTSSLRHTCCYTRFVSTTQVEVYRCRVHRTTVSTGGACPRCEFRTHDSHTFFVLQPVRNRVESTCAVAAELHMLRDPANSVPVHVGKSRSHHSSWAQGLCKEGLAQCVSTIEVPTQLRFRKVCTLPSVCALPQDAATAGNQEFCDAASLLSMASACKR